MQANTHNDALHAAIMRHKAPEAIAAIQAGADIDHRDDQGYSMVHRAILERQMPVVHALLQAGANPNTVAQSSWTPMHHAAACGEPSYLQILLEHGAKSDPETDKKETPLFVAILFSTPEVSEFLIMCGANPAHKRRGDIPLLHDAFAQTDLGHARALLRHGADPDATDGKGLSAAGTLRKQNNDEALILLKAYGATIDQGLLKEPDEKWDRLTRLRACVGAGLGEEIINRLRAGQDDGEDPMKLAQLAIKIKKPEIGALIYAHIAEQAMERVRTQSKLKATPTGA